MGYKAELSQVAARYQGRIAEHGFSEKSLATGNRLRRQIRYRVLAEVGIQKGNSVLDAGCGLGYFRDFLFRYVGAVHYEGLDIVPEFIERCRSRHPGTRFYHMDFLSFKSNGSYDFIVASQVFNNRLRGVSNETIARKVLEKAYASCRAGVAIDFLTRYVDFREKHLFYYDPCRVFQWAKKLTKRVALRHDYPLYEFCIYLYKDFRGWKR